MCNRTSENLEIPRCAIAHLRSGPSDHPGMTEPRSRSPLPQQILEIEPVRKHGERAVLLARPLLFGPVPIQLDAVLVGIAQVQRLADAVIAGAVQCDAG